MKKLTRFFSITCIVAMLIINCIGCGSTSESTKPVTPAPTNAATAEPVKPAKSVTLRFSWWGSDPRHKATLDAIALYKTKVPNVTIEGEYMGSDGYKEKLMTQLVGGSAPDIIQMDAPWMADFTKSFNSFADLNQFKSLDTKGFDAAFVKSFGIIDDKLLGLPTGMNAMTMIINKDVLTKAGIKTDTVWDWDTLLSEGKKVNMQDSKSYFLASDQFLTTVQLLTPYLKQKTGKQLVNSDYTLGFDKAALVEAFTYIKKLFSAKVFEPAEQSFMFKSKYFENPIWTNKQAGAALEWASTLGARKEGFKASADVALPPIAKDAKDTGIIVRPAQLLSINSKSADMEEAAKFLNFFFNDKDALLVLKDLRSVPPTEQGRKVCLDANLIDPLVAKAVDLSLKKTGMVDNVISGNIQLQNIMIDTVEKLSFGKLTPEAAADDMIKQFTTKLTELKAAAK